MQVKRTHLVKVSNGVYNTIPDLYNANRVK